MPKPIKRMKLNEQVARTLSLQIISRELEPLSLLPNEDELCKTFDVSRTVIREAIRFMDANGLVEARPRIGTRICEPSKWNMTNSLLMQWRIESDPQISLIEDLVELRSAIEPMAAGLAAQRATAEQVEVMFQTLGKMKSAQTMDEQIEADIAFHLSILEACGNELMISSLRPVIVSTLGPTFKLYMKNMEDAKQSIPMHSAVISAIKARDSEAAIEAMRKAIIYAAEDFERAKEANPKPLVVAT